MIYKDKTINVATVFSGIGSIEFALKRLGVKTNLVFACDNGEREIEYNLEEELNSLKKLNNFIEKKKYVDDLYISKTRRKNYVRESYLANYDINEDRFFEDIRLLDGKDFQGTVDLFVGGSPCQSFSSVGFKKGLEDARGTLFYDFARLIKEIQPKVFIYENVRNLINHDKKNTWEIVQGVFKSLNYDIDHQILNSMDFGIPQKRNRVFVIGVRKDINKEVKLPLYKKMITNYKMQDFLLNNCALGDFKFNSFGEIEINKQNQIESVDKKYFLSPAVKKYVLAPGTKNWYQKVEIDLPIARTLLKTMGNCHRAGVDNYITDNGELRMLTEREALRLMGFTDDFNIVVSKSQMYKQAGNSIVVDVMMEIVKQLFMHKIF